jgi:hypothetical protein
MNTSLLIIVTIFTTLGCRTAGNSAAGVKENDGPEIARDFENSNATGTVLAMSIEGVEKETPANKCFLEWQSYMFGNDPQRAGHSLHLGIDNSHGYAFIVSQMPYDIVPPFKKMPTEFSKVEADRINPSTKTETKIKDDLMTVTKTWHERHQENLRSMDYDKTTVVTLHFNPDFSKAWDMTMTTHEESDFDNNGHPQKIRDTSAKCDGQFTVTKNVVVMP